MEQCDQDTILRSLVDLTKLLDLNPTFLSLLQQKYRVFSPEMVEDILVCGEKVSMHIYIWVVLVFSCYFHFYFSREMKLHSWSFASCLSGEALMPLIILWVPYVKQTKLMF